MAIKRHDAPSEEGGWHRYNAATSGRRHVGRLLLYWAAVVEDPCQGDGRLQTTRAM
jgi:hypothetical protein